MGSSKAKPRSSDRGYTGDSQFASVKLARSLWRVAARTAAEAAQKKIDERHTNATEPVPHSCKQGGRSKYPAELVAEALQMVRAGWCVASVARVIDVPYGTVLNWAQETTRAPSAASVNPSRRRK